jgi:drug/metabolite transporter (DMT)-like permease
VSWYLLSILTALLYGGQSVYLKALADDLDQLLVTWSVFAFALPLYAAMLLATGLPAVSSGFWLPLAVSLAVNLLAWPLFVRSVQTSDISLVMPLLAFTPVFILGVEYLLLGDTPGGWGLAGIGLIVFGAYILNIRRGLSSLLEPLRALLDDRGAVLMLVVALLWSLSATVEKLTVTASSPSFYMTTFGALFTLLFAPVVALKTDDALGKLRAHLPILAGAGGLTGLMALAQMNALQSTPLVNYVIAIKRAGMLVSVLLGWLLFDEENILFRAIGALLMVAGVGLIRLG